MEAPNMTEFENALADICRGWIGEELGWKDYIIKNSFPLLEIAKRQLAKESEKEKKLYRYQFFDSILEATECISNYHQDWNIVSIYPTGFMEEVCVVYYST